MPLERCGPKEAKNSEHQYEMPMGYLVSVESPVLVVFLPPHDDVFAFEEGRPTGVALAAPLVYNVVNRTLPLRTLAVAHALNLK